MAVTIETTDDFIRLLRENEEFRAAARREIMTQELLELPKEFKDYTAKTDRRLDNIEQSIRELAITVRELAENVRRLTVIVDGMRGYYLEGKMPSRLRQRIGRTLGLTRTRTIWMGEHYVQPPSRAEAFSNSVEEAFDRGRISEEQADRLIDTDMILRASRISDGEGVHIAVEASGVIGNRDIDRARESANILRKLLGSDAIPVVYGYTIAPEQAKMAQPNPEAGLEEVHIFLETERL